MSEILVKQILPQAWKEMAENAHLAVFDETWDKNLERVDFALVMVEKESNCVISYATGLRLDSRTVYLQYGGAFEKFRGTHLVYRSFQMMLQYLRASFSKIVTLVENTNSAMLRFYMKQSFLITGIRYFGNKVYLENSFGS